jgi:hypothetical protein
MGTVGQAANEAALFQPGDEPVDAGLGLELQRLLHLLERGRHAVRLQMRVDVGQQQVLFSRQHVGSLPVPKH